MPTSVLTGAKNKQVINIDIRQTKNDFIIISKQIDMESSMEQVLDVRDKTNSLE